MDRRDRLVDAVLCLAAAKVVPQVQQIAADHGREVRRLRARIKREGVHDSPGGYLGTADKTLRRYLRARKWDHDKAFVMYCNTVEWRRKEDVDRYRRDALGPLGAAGLRFAARHGYRSAGGVEAHPETRLVGVDPKEHVFRTFCAAGSFGRDKQNRPVYLERTGAMAPHMDITNKHLTRHDLTYRHIRQQEMVMARLDEIEEETGEVVDGQFAVLDMVNLSFMPNEDAIAVFKEVVTLDAAHYPETLGMQILINAPKLFQVVWRVVKGWIDPNTAKKIQILGTKYQPKLLELVDASQLPAEYGGTLGQQLEQVRWAQYKAKNKKITPLEAIEQGKGVAETLQQHAEELRKRWDQREKGDAEGADGADVADANDGAVRIRVPQHDADDDAAGEPQAGRNWSFAGPRGMLPSFAAGAAAEPADEEELVQGWRGGPHLPLIFALWALLCMSGAGVGVLLASSGRWQAFAVCCAAGCCFAITAAAAGAVSRDLRCVAAQIRVAAEVVATAISSGPSPVAARPRSASLRSGTVPFRRLQNAAGRTFSGTSSFSMSEAGARQVQRGSRYEYSNPAASARGSRYEYSNPASPAHHHHNDGDDRYDGVSAPCPSPAAGPPIFTPPAHAARQ